jgi:hypothetical protein
MDYDREKVDELTLALLYLITLVCGTASLLVGWRVSTDRRGIAKLFSWWMAPATVSFVLAIVLFLVLEKIG